jgi:hypothetical protein
MARRKPAAGEAPEREAEHPAPQRAHWKRALRVSLWMFGASALLLACWWCYSQAKDFLVNDPRFRVATRTFDDSDDAVRVSGAVHASRARVMAVFDRDRGHSLFDCDPERRRLELRGVDWVRDAVVRRVWPNRIEVRIYERTPVAFVRAAGAATGDPANPVAYRPLLIDEEGALQTPRGVVPPTLPLLIGATSDHDVEWRHRQVTLMQRVLRILKPFRQQIIEVDLSRPDDVHVTCQVGQQAYTLVLGREQFLERVELFMKEYESMRGQLDPRKIYDLTNEGRIIVIDSEPAPEKAR